MCKIWSMYPVLSAAAESSNEPKLLSTLNGHVAAVNVVRWSPNGVYLASGSDDKVIYIWVKVLNGSASNSFMSGGKKQQEKNIEHWNRVITFASHIMGKKYSIIIYMRKHAITCSIY